MWEINHFFGLEGSSKIVTTNVFYKDKLKKWIYGSWFDFEPMFLSLLLNDKKDFRDFYLNFCSILLITFKKVNKYYVMCPAYSPQHSILNDICLSLATNLQIRN